MLTERKKSLLNFIITKHIETAAPVGSSLLVDKCCLELSPATVRHEMVDLEKEGYIFQPHTSAGRIPTEKGYKFYIANFLKKGCLSGQAKKQLKKSIEADKRAQARIKALAKSLAELSLETIVVAFASNDVYYTGLANLFAKPEFAEQEIVCRLSAVIDHLDQVMYNIFSEITEKTKILIGSENPFGQDCGLIITGYKQGQSKDGGVFGILGPMRMDYNNNVSLIEYAQDLVRQI